MLHGHALLMQRNLSLYLHIHSRAINIFISHDLLPSDLLAQSVEQRWSNSKVVGSNPTLVGVFLCPCVGPFPFLGLTLTWYMVCNICTLHHILSLPFILTNWVWEPYCNLPITFFPLQFSAYFQPFSFSSLRIQSTRAMNWIGKIKVPKIGYRMRKWGG